jgi:hypothetical protein
LGALGILGAKRKRVDVEEKQMKKAKVEEDGDATTRPKKEE